MSQELWTGAGGWRTGAGADQGFAGGFAGLLFGFAIFFVGTLLVTHAWAVVETKAAVVDAARQAARTYVEAQDPASGMTDAKQAALSSLAGTGRDPARASVTLGAGQFGRCDRITIRVTYPAPALVLPALGSLGALGPLGGQEIQADHSELVDPYRTGLPGTALCP